MNIACLIDSLTAGGAQRQIVTIAIALKKKGHNVTFIVYHERNHFLELLKEAKIICNVISDSNYIKKIISIRKILIQIKPDVVLTFLKASSLYAEILSIFHRKWGLVVSERIADPNIDTFVEKAIRQFHRFADVVICNSFTNKLLLEDALPYIKKKTCVVYNMVDFKYFECPDSFYEEKTDCQFNLIIAAGYMAKKNMINVAKAIKIIKDRYNILNIRVDWYGDLKTDLKPLNEVEKYVKDNGLNDMIIFHKAINAISEKYCMSDAVALFSFYEGLPNVICEGMACGKPIIMSNVCDASNLVEDNINGFLCDPHSVEDIAQKIVKMYNLKKDVRIFMGKRSMKKAKEMFNTDKIVNQYETILYAAKKHKKINIDDIKEEKIPESALMTIQQWKKDKIIR